MRGLMRQVELADIYDAAITNNDAQTQQLVNEIYLLQDMLEDEVNHSGRIATLYRGRMKEHNNEAQKLAEILSGFACPFHCMRWDKGGKPDWCGRMYGDDGFSCDGESVECWRKVAGEK